MFGLDLGALLGGAVITETVFNLPGLGRLAYDAIAGKDLPVIMGTTLFAAVFIVLASVVVDILYSVIARTACSRPGARRRSHRPRCKRAASSSPAPTSVSSRSRKTESRCRAGAYFYRDTVR